MTREEEERAEQIAVRAVRQVLSELGLHAHDGDNLRRDFAYIRSSRETSEKIGLATRLAILGAFVSGATTLLWMGLKMAVGRAGGL